MSEKAAPKSFYASAAELAKLEAELECCICLRLFEEPKQLNCGHVCCAACVQPLINMAKVLDVFHVIDGGQIPSHATIECPYCRQESRVPEDDQFPTSLVVKNLVSHVKEARERSKTIWQRLHDKLNGTMRFLGQRCERTFYSILGFIFLLTLLWLNNNGPVPHFLPEAIFKHLLLTADISARFVEYTLASDIVYGLLLPNFERPQGILMILEMTLLFCSFVIAYALFGKPKLVG